MKMGEWGWYAGRNEEEFTAGPEASREAIIQVGLCDFDGQGFHILEAMKRPIDLMGFVDVDGFIERLIESVDEEHGDPEGYRDPVFDPSPAERDSLEGMLKAEIRRWQELHGIEPAPWVFTRMRNAEFIPSGSVEAEDDADG